MCLEYTIPRFKLCVLLVSKVILLVRDCVRTSNLVEVCELAVAVGCTSQDVT